MEHNEQSYENGKRDGQLDAIEKNMERVLKIVEGWEPLCEGRRGYLHERINGLYKWMLGAAVTLGIGMAGIFIKLFMMQR